MNVRCIFLHAYCQYNFEHRVKGPELSSSPPRPNRARDLTMQLICILNSSLLPTKLPSLADHSLRVPSAPYSHRAFRLSLSLHDLSILISSIPSSLNVAFTPIARGRSLTAEHVHRSSSPTITLVFAYIRREGI